MTEELRQVVFITKKIMPSKEKAFEEGKNALEKWADEYLLGCKGEYGIGEISHFPEGTNERVDLWKIWVIHHPDESQYQHYLKLAANIKE